MKIARRRILKAPHPYRVFGNGASVRVAEPGETSVAAKHRVFGNRIFAVSRGQATGDLPPPSRSGDSCFQERPSPALGPGPSRAIGSVGVLVRFVVQAIGIVVRGVVVCRYALARDVCVTGREHDDVLGSLPRGPPILAL
jgi:hypothetical protein